MKDVSPLSEPISALSHRGVRQKRDIDAVSLLTVYLVLLLAIPSNVTITALGSLGRPSLLWGVVLMVFWAGSRLQKRDHDIRPVKQPIRTAFVVFLVIVLVSFAFAMFRGQPSDQVSPAMTALVRMLSWAGVLLVAIDGIRTMNDLTRLVRRIVIAAGLLALLGIAQFITKQTLLDAFNYIPGLSNTGGGVLDRGGVTRASGTAIHPLEYATALTAIFPLAIAAGISHGFQWEQARKQFAWWLPAASIAIIAIVGVSRSAIIGFGVAVVAMVPALPRRYRLVVVGVGIVMGGLVVMAVPGLLSSTLALFTGAGSDPSTQSRVGALDRAPEFILSSPFVGAGFGTFLPRYYIFDNAWVLLAIEVGILGVIAFAAMVFAAVWSALMARKHSHQPDVRLVGYALAVSIVVPAILFIFFDGLSFPISAGMFFMLIGLCGGLRNIAIADAKMGMLRG